MSTLVNQCKIKPLEYVQLIARASMPNCKEQHSKLWIPYIEPRMGNFQIKDKAKLMYYVLHSRHGNLSQQKDKLEAMLGEDFKEIVEKAKPFI